MQDNVTVQILVLNGLQHGGIRTLQVGDIITSVGFTLSVICPEQVEIVRLGG